MKFTIHSMKFRIAAFLLGASVTAGYLAGQKNDNQSQPETEPPGVSTTQASPTEGKNQTHSSPKKNATMVFKQVIQPILAEKCHSCHGNGKAKGKLSMNTYQEILKGGSSGDITLIPGDSKNSLLISTLLLPLDDDEHMPPAKKTQLSKDEINILTWWVNAGAPKKASLAAGRVPDEIRQAIAAKSKKTEPISEIERLKRLAEQKSVATKQRQSLDSWMNQNLPKRLQNLTRFVSPYSTEMRFSSVPLRDTFTDQDFLLFKDLAPHFSSIDLSYASISQKTIDNLKLCPNLSHLRLAHTKLTAADITSLQSLKKLQSLSLHSSDVGPEVLQQLVSLPSLKTLYLWNTPIPREQLLAFKAANPSIAIIF